MFTGDASIVASALDGTSLSLLVGPQTLLSCGMDKRSTIPRSRWTNKWSPYFNRYHSFPRVSSVLPTVSLTLHAMLLETPIRDENKPHKSDFGCFIV